MKKLIDRAENLLRQVNIFPRLFGIMLALTIVPMISIASFNFHEYITAIQKDTEGYLSLLIGNVSVQIDSRFEQYERMARAFYADRSNLKLLEQNASIAASDASFLSDQTFQENSRTISQRLYALSGKDPHIANLEFITPYGQYTMLDYDNLPKGGMLKDPESFREGDFWKAALEKKGYPAWFDTTTNRSLIYKAPYSSGGIGNTFTMTTAVYTIEDRQFIGVLMCNVDAAFLKNSLTNYAFYGTGNTFLLTDSTVLAVLNPNINAPNFDWNENLLQNVLGRESGAFLEKIQGRNIFVSFKKNPRLELYVAHVVDIDTLMQPAYYARRRGLLLTGILILACVLLARLGTESISAPLKKLVNSMTRFGKEEFCERCVIDGNDELTLVGRQFNQMAENTQALVEEIVNARLREKSLELSRANAELNALQMQINPHFLYNTLDQIRWAAIRVGDGENDASRMIDSFCRLMRMTVKKNENMVPVEEELEHAAAYIEVVNFRHTRKIQLECQVFFDAGFYRVPKLTLQPLIENAVVHGFGKRTENAVIRIHGWQEGDTAFMTVSDNGKGMNARQLEELRQSLWDSSAIQSSIGLHNVNQRYLLCFGEKYGVSVESEPQKGTCVTIRFPAGPLAEERSI